MISAKTRDSFDSELESALVDGARAVKSILTDDDANDRDKIGAFNAIVGAAGLKGQRAAEAGGPKPGSLSALNERTVEALVGAVAGLVRIAGGTLDPATVKTAAERAMIAEVVTTELPQAPGLEVTVDIPAPKIVIPQYPTYLDDLETPRSVEVKRMKRGEG